MNKPEVGSGLWWLFVIFMLPVCALYGWCLGTVAKRILAALALPVLADLLIRIAVCAISFFSTYIGMQWLQKKLFKETWIAFRLIKPTESSKLHFIERKTA